MSELSNHSDHSDHSDHGMMDARKAQQFFREAITCCMEKNHVKFSTMVNDYLTAHNNLTFLDVFKGFQTEGKNLLHIACSSGCDEIVQFIMEKEE